MCEHKSRPGTGRSAEQLEDDVRIIKLLSVLTLVLGGTLALNHANAQEGGPPPTAGKVLASGLQGTQGATIGPDGALYVAEGGTGGPAKFTTPDGDGYFGLTGRVSRIDPTTGERTTVATGIPSGAESPDGQGFGIVDVAFLNGKLYYLISGGFNYIDPSLAAYPNGVYEVQPNGSSKLIADISKFNDDNPVAFPDAGPGGNPFGIIARDGGFYVTDGNYNRVLRVTLDGAISILTSFDNVVTTGLATKSGGPLIVTEFGAFPFAPKDGKVIQVGVPTGTQTELANGYSHIIAAGYGPDGKLYALSMGDQADPTSGDEAVPFTGKLLRVNGDGTMTPIVDGLMFPTSLDITGATAYATSLIGQVYQIPDFTSLPALPAAEPTPAETELPAPTATPPTGVVTAPNTGAGPASPDTSAVWTLALIAGAIGLSMLGAGALTRRR